MSTNAGIADIYVKLVFAYEQLELLRDTCNQLQKDNEVLREAVLGLQEHALEVKARMTEGVLQKELKHYVRSCHER